MLCGPRALGGGGFRKGCHSVSTDYEDLLTDILFFFARHPLSRIIALHTAPRHSPNLPECCSETLSREFWPGHFWVERLGFCTSPALALISALASSHGHGREEA